jgi:hypothetical protein
MSVSRVLLVALAVAAAAAAAILLNLLLLGRASAQNDPVGRLSPRAHLPAAPGWTIRPAPTTEDRGRNHDGADD